MAEVKNKVSTDPKSAFKCEYCREVFHDVSAYTEHLQAKQHKKNVMKQKFGKKYLEAKELLEEKSNNNIEADKKCVIEKGTPKSEEEEEDSDEDDVYTCAECEKICTGLLNFKLHLSGSKHLKKLKQLKTMKELKDKEMIPKNYKAPDEDLLGQIFSKNMYSSSNLMCEICSVKCTGPESFKQHCKGETHKRNEAKLKIKKEIESESPSSNISKENLEDTYSCDVCEKVFTGILPYKQHIESGSHLKREIINQRLEKVKDLCITSSSNSKLQCKECNKKFSGPAPFEAHLKSSSHKKLKNKINVYEELQKNYPEMVNTSMKNDSETDDSDEEIVKPACGICNMIFSGPEVALDHFGSDKHKKALKRKKKIEKNKGLKKSGVVLKNSISKHNKTKKTEVAASSSEEDFIKIPDESNSN